MESNVIIKIIIADKQLFMIIAKIKNKKFTINKSNKTIDLVDENMYFL